MSKLNLRWIAFCPVSPADESVCLWMLGRIVLLYFFSEGKRGHFTAVYGDDPSKTKTRGGRVLVKTMKARDTAFFSYLN